MVLLVVIFINFALLFLGVLLDLFPRGIYRPGAIFYLTSIGLFPCLIFISTIYSFFMSIKKKCLYVVAIYLAVLLFFIEIIFLGISRR